MKFCGDCGSSLELNIPEGDVHERLSCVSCGSVHYVNPKIVSGCVPLHEGKVLLCRRAIEPSFGRWTLPGGFLENGETVEQCAQRETLEEANARVEILSLLTVTNVISAGQVHMFYEGRLQEPLASPGIESLEVRFFSPHQIPWDDLAFSSVEQTLKLCFNRLFNGDRRSLEPLHLMSARAPKSSCKTPYCTVAH